MERGREGGMRTGRLAPAACDPAAQGTQRSSGYAPFSQFLPGLVSESSPLTCLTFSLFP